MGKKRAREAEGKEVPPANNDVDKMDEDSSDDEVRDLGIIMDFFN